LSVTVAYITIASPDAKAESNEATIMDIQLNSSGETFGSSSHIINFEDEPDLILARGIDGTEGYVKKTELYDDTVASSEEAVIYMKSGNANKVRFIPLSKSDGTTVIDQFQIN